MIVEHLYSAAHFIFHTMLLSVVLHRYALFLEDSPCHFAFDRLRQLALGFIFTPCPAALVWFVQLHISCILLLLHMGGQVGVIGLLVSLFHLHLLGRWLDPIFCLIDQHLYIAVIQLFELLSHLVCFFFDLRRHPRDVCLDRVGLTRLWHHLGSDWGIVELGLNTLLIVPLDCQAIFFGLFRYLSGQIAIDSAKHLMTPLTCDTGRSGSLRLTFVD